MTESPRSQLLHAGTFSIGSNSTGVLAPSTFHRFPTVGGGGGVTWLTEHWYNEILYLRLCESWPRSVP